MTTLSIELIQPEAMKILKGMEDLKLIKINFKNSPSIQAYLNKMRLNSISAPSDEIIAEIVKEVRSKRISKNSTPL
jgi:hypothetical protein